MIRSTCIFKIFIKNIILVYILYTYIKLNIYDIHMYIVYEHIYDTRHNVIVLVYMKFFKLKTHVVYIFTPKYF